MNGMTTSANIAGVPTPFLVVARDDTVQPWPYGQKGVVSINDIKPGKKPKKKSRLYYGQVGMLRIMTGMEGKQ